MKYFVTELDVLKDLKNAIERYCSNGLDILWNIDEKVQSKLSDLKNLEFQFSRIVQETEADLRNARSALYDCESQGDDEDGYPPNCSFEEDEVYECERKFEISQKKMETYKQEIHRLELNVERYQNAKLRFKSTLEYKNDATVTRLLSIINKLEAYVSYTLLPSFNSESNSSTNSSSSKGINYVYKEFKDRNETYNHWVQYANPWQASLTTSEFNSLNEYKNSGYGNINAYLRGSLSDNIKNHVNQIEEIRRHISYIDSALTKSVIPENIVAYRAFDSKGTDFKNLKLYSQNQFVSTALNKSGAEFFLKQHQNFGRNPVMAKIYISKGKNGAFMDGIKRMIEDGNEILLPRNSRFKVLSCETINGIQNVELKLL